ncbi:hypothetical protein CAPTEDRAFT_203483 [Capitella teleta]|uniref:DNA polymerase delta subunit 3 n=1 Tax=Capitella teleta TaxID=283909 RepID=R7VEN2_CAPTE|nr:hypothetical protein CAPTEDRAFT_203483 [Capitella teleta]|eukprot:ELU14130.1 hypothetical protein CAPTEDRAFT_203483 [Capitella teleta]
MSTDSVYLENLDEFINDENKIVRMIYYTWSMISMNTMLCRTMRCLIIFMSNHLGDNTSPNVECVKLKLKLYDSFITVTFKWLSATLNVHVNVAKQMLFEFTQIQRNEKENDKLNGVLLVQLVPEEMLDAFKKTLSCVMSCHIYSVQRSKVKVPPNASSSISSKKSKGIASMFSKGPEKKDEKKEKPEVKQEKEVKETPVQKEDKTKNSMAAFFSKQASKPKASEPEREPQEPKTMKESAKPVRKPDLKKKKKALSDEEELPRKEKKRRRIQTTVFDSSSSSEEEEEDIDMEDPIPPTPPPPPPREPSPTLPEFPVKPKLALNGNEACATGAKRRVRKRKLVSKHTTTPDGYMQTEKVWEDYSTDEEEPIPKKKPETQNAAQKKPAAKMTKTSPNKGTKQMSLTNFFKKK